MRRRAFLTLIGGAAAIVAAGIGAPLAGADVAELRLGLGKRVVFISDLHLHDVRRLDLPPYDLLLIGGDTYDEKTPSLDVVVETLRRLPGPKVAVLGNHEHWSRGKFPMRQGVKALEDAGVHVLADDWVQLGGLRIHGLDWRENPRSYPAATDADVVLVHSPDAFQAARRGVYLAGHTHGGQICLPLNVPVYTISYFGYTWGLYRRGEAVMYVTRGLGEMFPRVYCRREIVIAV